jgi:FMN phosphatase YigB (HAD superfamily)
MTIDESIHEKSGRQLKAVLLDWRGTLCVTPSDLEWVTLALAQLGREPSQAETLLAQLEATSGWEEQLDSPDIDTSQAVHRTGYYKAFDEAGFDPDLADALYAVESDPRYNPFASDTKVGMSTIKDMGALVVVISDIHFDLRPTFQENQLDDMVDEYLLSFEVGLQKPDPRIFQLALDRFQVDASEVVMIGDRESHDGGATSLGISTVILPTLTDVDDARFSATVKRLLS